MKYSAKRLLTFILAAATALSLLTGAFAANTATANEDGVRVRRTASEESEPVTSLREGDTVVVSSEADENGWVEISYTDAAGNTGTGYVSTDQLTVVDTSTTSVAAVVKEEREANAVSENVAPTALVVENGVRIREGANTESSLLATLCEGEVVTILDTSVSGWIHVSYSGSDGTAVTGYISSEYLEVNAIGSGTVNTRTLIIREDADATSAIVGIAKEGDTVQIYAVSNGWYKIECGQYTGYVDGGCITGSATSTCVGYGTVTTDGLTLRATASTDGEQLTTIPAGVTFRVTSNDTEGWYGITYNGKSGYVSSEYVTLSDSVDSGYIMVTADTLSLRAGAGTQYARLAVIPYGTLLTVQGTVGDWYVVSYDGIVGYANGEYVSATTSAGYQTYPDRVKTTTSRLALRSEASTDGDVLARLDEGVVVAVSGETDGWYKVTYGDKTGYIKASYAEETEDAVTEVREQTTTSTGTSTSTGTTTSSSGKTSTSEESSSENTSTSYASGSGSAVLAYAQRFIGNPYVFGGTSLTNGCDCSGFVMSVYAHFGVYLSHSSYSMRSAGYAVSLSNIQVGDIVCYSGHVGIYAGGGKVLAARTERTGIGYHSLYFSTVVAVRRIF